jgi:hypothetical protein
LRSQRLAEPPKMGVSFVTCQKHNERSRFHGCACMQNPLLFFNLVPLERMLVSLKILKMKVSSLSFPHRHQVAALAPEIALRINSSKNQNH